MRATLKKALLLGVCASAASLGLGSFVPQAAQAQIGTCPLLTPAPCIVFDYKRLGDEATKYANQIQQYQTKLTEIQGWTNGQAIIGKMAQAVGIPSLANPQVLTGMPQTFPGITATTSFLDAKKSTTSMFADTPTNDAMADVQSKRDQNSRAALVDGVGIGWQSGKILQSNMDEAARIQTAAAASTDLRTDWAINSEAKRAVAQAKATQNYLWTAYLQVKSTHEVGRLPVEMGTAQMTPSTSSSGGAVVADNGEWAKLQQLIALNVEAKNILALLNATDAANNLKTGANNPVDLVINDYNDAVARQAALVAQFPQHASDWACHADHCSHAGQIVSDTVAALSAWDSQMAALRAEDISQLGSQFSSRGIDVAQMTAADIDPRQFLGTWGDPSKFTMITGIAQNLELNSLQDYIDGDSDNAEYRQFVYDYNDVRLEVAWKLDAYNEAIASRDTEIPALVTSLQTDSTTNLTDTDVMARLKEIGTQGDALGNALVNSTDAATATSAKQAYADLQATLAQGTALPAPATYNPSSCQDAADYAAQNGIKYDITNCQNGVPG